MLMYCCCGCAAVGIFDHLAVSPSILTYLMDFYLGYSFIYHQIHMIIFEEIMKTNSKVYFDHSKNINLGTYKSASMDAILLQKLTCM